MKKIVLSAALSLLTTMALASSSDTIPWQTWSDEAFVKAKTENRLIILDLEAVWCHWCHVMDQKTYTDPAVQTLLKDKFVTLKVDQDSRPDLAARYMDYGWPATIFFNAKGEEIAKRSGYIPPEEMTKLLKKLVQDPSPEESNTVSAISQNTGTPYLSETLRNNLQQAYRDEYDTKNGAWGHGGHKFLDWDSTEYAMSQAAKGDKLSESMAVQTLNAQLALIDPVWGGVYQYSHGGTWQNPHFEKIMSMQAENMRIYALAYNQFKNPTYLNTAEAIHRYVKTFLTSPDGAFYTSQDADLVQGQHSHDYFALSDAERRQQGIPRIDKHIYARENGWVIHALTALYSTTGNPAYLEDAEKAANWIIANRSLPDGGFRHDTKDAGGPYLGDTVSMGRAFLGLYRVTGERQWLSRAEDAARFIQSHFQGEAPGYASAAIKANTAGIKPTAGRDENVAVIRFANLLNHYTGNAEYKTMAEAAMRFVSIPQIAKQPFSATTLLADMELSQPPLHLTIVGAKSHPQAKALYQAALKYPASYERIEWLDKTEGSLPNPDVQYPQLEKPAAFVCTNSRCSIPIFEPMQLGSLVDRLLAKPQ